MNLLEKLPTAEWASTLPAEQLHTVLAHLASLQSAITARLIVESHTAASKDPTPRWTLTLADLEQRTGQKRRWLIEHAKELPFVAKFSRKNFRGDETLLIEWLEKRRVQSRSSAR